MYDQFMRPTAEEVEEAINLWKLGIPTTKIGTKRALRLRERYDNVITALSSSEDPYHDGIVTELRVARGCVQEIIERRLQREQYDERQLFREVYHVK